MLWDNDVSVILMLAKWTPKSQKSDIYWPDHVNGALTFGDIKVYLVKVTVASDVEARELEVEKIHSDGKKELKRVIHYHYLDWPDHGLPHSMDSFLRLRNVALAVSGPS